MRFETRLPTSDMVTASTNVKQVLCDELARVDPTAHIHRTEYFNHTYVPDVVLAWDDRGPSGRCSCGSYPHHNGFSPTSTSSERTGPSSSTYRPPRRENARATNSRWCPAQRGRRANAHHDF